MTLTRDRIARAVADKTGIRQREAADLVGMVLGEIVEGLCETGRVKLTGFGVFGCSEKSARMGRNPQNGDPHLIGPRRCVSFRPGGEMREKLRRENPTATGSRVQSVATGLTSTQESEYYHGLMR